jgi:hypothetical protein
VGDSGVIVNHPARPLRILFQRLAHELRDHTAFSLSANVTAPLQPVRPVMSSYTPTRNGSAAIHDACSPETFLLPATTAASMRSGRCAR